MFVALADRYEVVESWDGEYGAVAANGQWTGLVGMLARGVSCSDNCDLKQVDPGSRGKVLES